MYDIGYDIVIDDDVINDAKDICQSYSEEIEGYVKEYYDIMKQVYEKGVNSGKFHDKIGRFNEAIKALKDDAIKPITDDIKKDVENFLKDFDVADNCLYR